MYPSSAYTLQNLQGIDYLLPIGQGVATFHRQLKLNASSAKLYREIETICKEDRNISRDALVEKLLLSLQQEHDFTGNDTVEIQGDLTSFIQMLQTFGVLIDTNPKEDTHLTHQALIGRVLLKFYDGDGYLSSEFNDFFLPKETIPASMDSTIQILFHPYPDTSLMKRILLVHTSELWVYQTDLGYLLEYPSSDGIYSIHLSNDGTQADFYVREDTDEKLRYDIFHAVRLVMSYLLQKQDAFLLHSASILYEGQAWLFSGPSGTGKSTHTALWNKRFQTPFINGDLNLITIEKDGQQSRPMTYGIPWCGTSGIYSTEKYPLGGIIILHQSADNHVLVKKDDEKQLSVLQRLISPFWTIEQMEQNLAFTDALLHQIPIWHLYCNMEEEAAICMKQEIDSYLSKIKES